jgi:rubrerythrin
MEQTKEEKEVVENAIKFLQDNKERIQGVYKEGAYGIDRETGKEYPVFVVSFSIIDNEEESLYDNVRVTLVEKKETPIKESECIALCGFSHITTQEYCPQCGRRQ